MKGSTQIYIYTHSKGDGWERWVLHSVGQKSMPGLPAGPVKLDEGERQREYQEKAGPVR